MAEDEWGDFEGSEPGPKAVTAASAREHSQPLPADLFCSQEAAEDVHVLGGFEGAFSRPAAPWQATAATAQAYSKGQAVSYYDGRTGSWVPAKVGTAAAAAT